MSELIQPVLEAQTRIDAPPADVWKLVSDVRRMGEWSPECRKVIVWGRKPVRRGTWLTGFNRRQMVVWPTTSTVHVFDEGRSIGWHTRESGARWIFEIEPSDGGTLLRERREMPHGMTLVARMAATLALGGVDEHTEELREGMQTTLDRIKAAAEAKAP